MIEAREGQVEIDDFEADTLETMVNFMYTGNVSDEKMIHSDLLRLAEKYNIINLVDFCAKYLEENLSLENALDVLYASHSTNKKSLFDAAINFVCENRGQLVQNDSWKELMETNPKFASDVVISMLKLQ